MRQRAMLALALVAKPKLLIADEATSHLDVTLQAQIIALFKHLRKELGLSIVMISHDLGMVAHLADEVYVLDAGHCVEHGTSQAVMQNPQHQITQRMVNAFSL